MKLILFYSIITFKDKLPGYYFQLLFLITLNALLEKGEIQILVGLLPDNIKMIE